jgi:hypothetical protein
MEIKVNASSSIDGKWPLDTRLATIHREDVDPLLCVSHVVYADGSDEDLAPGAK